MEKEFTHSEAKKRLSREEERARECCVQEITDKYERMECIAKHKAQEISQVWGKDIIFLLFSSLLSQSLTIAHHTAQLRDSIRDSYLSKQVA